MDYYASKYDEKMKRFKGVVWKRKEDFLLNAAMELYGEFCTETFDKYTSKLDARESNVSDRHEKFSIED